MSSVLSGVLEFLETIGLFDVILPFLMIYVMIFALLERTKIFGTEKIDVDGKETEISKKNLNSIFAFAVAFFAILSTKVVETISAITGPLMLLLFIIVLFIVLVSAFKKDEGIHEFSKPWVMVFIVVIIITIVFIALNTLTTPNGETWLDYSWDYVTDHTNTGFVGAIILLVAMAGFVMWIGKEPKKSSDSSEDDDD